MSTDNVDLTPAQCRAARALVEMTQPALAAKAQLGLSTIVDFERTRRPVSSTAIKEIKKALESAGVVFIKENGEGPGVRIKKVGKGKG